MCEKCLSLVYRVWLHFFFFFLLFDQIELLLSSSRQFALTNHTCCLTDLMDFQVLLGAVKLVHIQSDCGWKRHRMQMMVCFFFFFWLFFSRDNAEDFRVQMAKHTNISSVPMRPHTDQSKDRASKRLSSDSNGTSEGGMGSSTPVELTALEEAFRRFAIHGDTRATGKDMHGKNWSKLCKDCGVIDGKSVTLTDVDIVFSKVK